MLSAYSDKLEPDQLRDLVEVAVAGHTEQERDRVADVADDHLDGQWGVVDVEIVAPPGQ